jgi:hypothetical protein
MAFGLGASGIGLVMLIIGTRFQKSAFGGVVMIVGSAVMAVGLIFLGMQGLIRASDT